MKVEPEIIHQDSSLLVLNKPALIHSVSQRGSEGDSIAAWLSALDAAFSAASEHPLDGGLVNRLDYETSGILIAARTRAAWQNMRQQFEQKIIKKTYHAIVEGKIIGVQTVQGYIGNRYRGSKKVLLSPEPAKRFLASRSEIKSAQSSPENDRVSLAQIATATGARHQVRVHCASIGHPLAGDALYGGAALHALGELPPFVLHAASISFLHPEDGRALNFTARDPAYIQTLLNEV